MNNRLPKQAGEWIDRSRELNFTFEGMSCRGYQGDVITSALYANGMRMVGRSFKYHRARGSYSMAGHDAHAMLTDGVRTNIRGDQVSLESGMNLRAVNTAGGLKRDRLNITERFSRFMPVGFYYKAFYKPRWLFPFHEKQMRKVAGLGAINANNAPTNSPKDYAWCDVLVIGGGGSGMSAALAAADGGARVMLVDEGLKLGGSLVWQGGGDHGGRVEPLAAAMVAKVEAHENIEVRCSTMAGGYYGDHWMGLFNGEKLTKLRAKSVVFATGVIEQPAVFGNNDLPGVMLASAAQRLMRLFAIKPFEQAVVLAGNDDGYRATLDLLDVGVVVKAVVDLRREDDVLSTDAMAQVRATGVAVRMGCGIYEAQARGTGRDRIGVAGVVVCPLNDDGELDAKRCETIACDGVAVSVGWTPNAGLLYQSGVRFVYDDGLEQLLPDVVPATVFVAGRANGVYAWTDRLRDGERAGLGAAGCLGEGNGEVGEGQDVGGRSKVAMSHGYPIFEHPGKKNFVDFDEDLHLKDFVNAHQEGYDNIELMKRYSTVGMGPSQGKIANVNSVRILAKLNGKTINETGTTTSRPFYQPVPIGHLAGRRFHPMRHTPMHDWHKQHGAVMFHAGAWYRPEFYRNGSMSREDCILSEAMHVRKSLGLIDLSTLGKLFICGADAGAFLERLYTGHFASMKIGKQRYAVALDETGVMIEDGVVSRLSEDRYYVTATSSGVAAFYREMQRWALVWGMDVTLINATGQYAAMNLAGPKSREVLAGLTDVDLSNDAFPFLGTREGMVAGVQAIMMRVGFVGELGYELHVPANMGLRLWERLMDAGAGIRPFGVEAQRLLRLEMGHLIISHDTDALTHPDEADIGWALADDKPFYVGQRSIAVMRKQTLERKLVGIRWEAGYSGPLPEECHLVIDEVRHKMVGRVTSVAHRSTLGYALGMAFVHPDMARPGTKIDIRVDGGAMSRAEVVALPHHDGEKQKG